VRIAGRDEPLPSEMQGQWVNADDPTAKLIICGAEIMCFGRAIEYDYKEIHEVDGALTVSSAQQHHRLSHNPRRRVSRLQRQVCEPLYPSRFLIR